MKTSLVRGLLAGLAFMAGLALAASAPYFGYNPSTGLEALHGSLISGGTSPVVSGTCGTRGATTGGAFAGTVVSGAVTTCTTTLTFPAAAPSGWQCRFTDLTTPADVIPQASSTTTSCTSTAATIVSGDTVGFIAVGY